MKHIYVPVPGVTLESMKNVRRLPPKQFKISGACARGEHHRCHSKPENCHCGCGHVFSKAKK